MGKDSEDLVSLPSPPPPRPAARREAIDAALRKFDGIDEPSAKRQPRRFQWAAIHRRPAGALVAAAIVAVIGIPAIQIALRDQPAEVASEERASNAAQPSLDAQPAKPLSEEPQPSPDQAVAVEAPPATSNTAASPTVAAEERSRSVSVDSAQKAGMAAPLQMRAAPAPPPMMAAPPPPPPPPPPAAEAQADATADSGNIVVTGTRVPRPNLESASPVTVIGVTSNDFLSTLRAALDDNDRRAVIRLVAIPLRVNFNGGSKTYRSSRDIERDFDRIFTPAVRQAVSGLNAYDLATRDGGRLKGNGRIWFGCGKTVCRDEGAIRVREVRP